MINALPSHRHTQDCHGRGCGHPPEAHLATPELSTSGEAVVWCAECRRHEVRRPGWRLRLGLAQARKRRPGVARYA